MKFDHTLIKFPKLWSCEYLARCNVSSQRQAPYPTHQNVTQYHSISINIKCPPNAVCPMRVLGCAWSCGCLAWRWSMFVVVTGDDGRDRASSISGMPEHTVYIRKHMRYHEITLEIQNIQKSIHIKNYQNKKEQSWTVFGNAFVVVCSCLLLFFAFARWSTQPLPIALCGCKLVHG